MLPSITRREIKNIDFPVYKLNSDELYYSEGILYCSGLVVDDRNLDYPTLGMRRLHIRKENKYPLTSMAEDYMAMLKAKYIHFVDSSGKAFSYKKTVYSEVKSHKIKKVTKHEKFSKLFLVGITIPLIIKRPPPAGYGWASVFYVNRLPWEVYEYTEVSHAPFKRMI